MITNAARIFHGAVLGTPEHYAITLVKFYIVDPTARHFDLTITSAVRSPYQQRKLTDAAGNPIPASKKARNVSQHVRGEAIDFSCPDMPAAFQFIDKNIPTWQLFLYIEEGRPRSIHASIPPRGRTSGAKTQMNVDGTWKLYEGTIPVVRA